MKYLSYRIRRNGFKPNKKGKIFYKSIKQQIEHDLRLEVMEDGYLKNNNRDWKLWKKSLIVDNEVNEEYLEQEWKKCQDDYKEHSVNNRKLDLRTKPFLTHILSFSSGFMLDFEKTKELGQVIKDFVNEEFGGFLTIVGHRSESSIHYHISTLNYDFRTHKSIGRNIDTSLLQDKISTYLRERNLNYGHTRGISKEVTKTIHKELLEGRKVQLKKLNDDIEDKIKLNDELQNGINDLKKEYNNLVTKYQDLAKRLKKLISEILLISKDTKTVKKLERIENSIKDSLEGYTSEELTKLIDRMGRSEKTLVRTSNAIIKKQKKMKQEPGKNDE